MKWFVLAVGLVATGFMAITRGEGPEQVVDTTHPIWRWDDAVDHQVVVEGLAWGHMNKGLSDWVVTGEGGRVYVSGADYSKLNGKLVRIAGTLRKKHMPAAPAGAQGYGRAFDYFEIEVAKAELIETTEAAWLRLASPVAK